MAEVKSTLEIALEKAKNMEISSDERRRFKHEAMVSRARDIFQDHMNNFHRSDIIRQALKESLEDAPLLRQCLTELLVGALEPGQSSERIWEGLHELGVFDTDTFKKTLTRITENSVRSQGETREQLKDQIVRDLSEIGISGTALDINLEASGHCKDTLQELNQKTRADLDNLYQEITRAIEKCSNSPRRT